MNEEIWKNDLKNNITWPILKNGKFGPVYKYKQYAIKVLNPDKYELNMISYINSEISIQTALIHDNIVRLYSHFIYDRNKYLVMEYMDKGDLFSIMKATPDKRFDEKTSLVYFDAMKCAIDYCHSQGVIHRDVKIDNVLVDSQNNIKLADFGYAIRFKPGEKFTDLCGTLDYLCPEMIDDIPYDCRVDFWCLGVSLFEMTAGKQPFWDTTRLLTFRRIKNINYKFPTYISENIQNIVRCLLVRQE